MPVPGSAQHALLRASLLDADMAAAAWREWMSLTTIEAIDEDSTWLLPLLYWNLSSRRLAPAAGLVRYENVFRHNWYKNNLRLHQAKPGIEAIAATGGTPFVRGGAALALGYYPALAARPFETVDVSPHAAGADAAIACEWRGVRLRIPAPATLLEDICAASDAWDRRSSLLWIADVVILLRRHPDAAEHVSARAEEAVAALQPLGLLP